MSAPLFSAIWRGPFDGELLGHRTLRRGDVHQVTQRDLESDHWERVKPAPRGKQTDSASDSGSDS